MELKQLSTGKNDFELVQEVVEAVTGRKILGKNRERKCVESRMIFSLLMVELGYPLSQIGNFLDKDHTTIVHYKKSLRGFMETDSYILRTYLKCKEIVMGEKQLDETLNKDDSKIRELAIQNKLDILKADYDALVEENKTLKSTINLMENRRFIKIFEVIKENTKEGYELIVERKIRKMFDE